MNSKDWKAQRWLISLLDDDYIDSEKIELQHTGQIDSTIQSQDIKDLLKYAEEGNDSGDD